MQTRTAWWSLSLALLLTCSAALGKVPADRKCRSLKVKEIGKYAACRLKADALAVKKAATPSYEKCDAKLDKRFIKIEAKFGGACPTLDDRGDLTEIVEVCASDLVCRTLDTPPPLASVVVIPNVLVADGNGRTFKLQNPGGTGVEVLCGYVASSCDFATDFFVTLGPLETVEWNGQTGLVTMTNSIPPVPLLPFHGDLVCVETKEKDSSNPEPVSANSLRGSTRVPGECPESALGLRGLGSNNGDPEIRFGTEYDPCPAELDPDFIMTCWSDLPNPLEFFCDP